MANWVGKWSGGQVYRNRTSGQLVYVIARMHKGIRYHLKLPSTSERDALAELALNEVHIASVKRYCVGWANALRGRPLRSLRLADLEHLLQRWPTARNSRIASLKSFCRYYVDKGLLASHENSVALLRIEKRPPEKLVRAKGYDIPARDSCESVNWMFASRSLRASGLDAAQGNRLKEIKNLSPIAGVMRQGSHASST